MSSSGTPKVSAFIDQVGYIFTLGKLSRLLGTQRLEQATKTDLISRKRRVIKLADWEELDSIFPRDRIDVSYVRWSRWHRADLLEDLLHPTWYQNDESLAYGIPGILESVRCLSW